MKPPTLDCCRCGACCDNPAVNREMNYTEYVQIRVGDRLLQNPKLVRRFAVRNERDEVHMRLDRDGRCAALVGDLGRSVSCRIYDDRPQVCRNMEPGSERCLAARREHGFEPADTPAATDRRES